MRERRIHGCSVGCVVTGCPSALVFVLMGWSVYVEYGLYVPHYVNARASALSVALGVAQGLGYLALWGLGMAHFMRALLADNSPRVSAAATTAATTVEEEFPVCRKCSAPKPPRCHHCSTCGRCCLKLDHHCPWVGNCVGFYNYKFFFCYLLYQLALLLYVMATTVPYVVHLARHWSEEFVASAAQVQIVVHAFVALVFTLSVSMLFGMHVSLLCRNQTTLETTYNDYVAPSNGGNRRRTQQRRRPENPYDLGTAKNVEQVLGKNKMLWFMPVFTSIGDGFHYPTRAETDRLSEAIEAS